jgi:hypothetical protein
MATMSPKSSLPQPANSVSVLLIPDTLPEELARRHSKLNFDSYIEGITKYVRAWASSSAEQNVFFQIVH